MGSRRVRAGPRQFASAAIVFAAMMRIGAIRRSLVVCDTFMQKRRATTTIPPVSIPACLLRKSSLRCWSRHAGARDVSRRVPYRSRRHGASYIGHQGGLVGAATVEGSALARGKPG
jgi:hypothetical protein